MASTGPATSPVAAVTRSKELTWFHSIIGSSLTPAGRQLLEQYGGIEPSEMENHLYKIVGASQIQDASSIPQLGCMC